jgi:hypothetical protein
MLATETLVVVTISEQSVHKQRFELYGDAMKYYYHNLNAVGYGRWQMPFKLCQSKSDGGEIVPSILMTPVLLVCGETREFTWSTSLMRPHFNGFGVSRSEFGGGFLYQTFYNEKLPR